MTEPKETAPVPVRKCTVDQVLNPTILGLLKTSPENEVVRTHVLSQIKVPLPDEAKTFEQIVDFVEFNIVPQPKPVAPPPRYAPGLEARVNYSERILGRISYRQNRTGHAVYNITRGSLMELVREAITNDASFDSLVNGVKESLECLAYEDNPSDLDESERELDDDSDEVIETLGSDAQVQDPQELERALRHYLSENAVEDLETLDGNE